MFYILESCPALELILCSNRHVTLRLTFFNRYSLFREPKFWGFPGVPPPKAEKTWPGAMCTVMHIFTSISAIVAEICNRTEKKQQILPCRASRSASNNTQARCSWIRQSSSSSSSIQWSLIIVTWFCTSGSRRVLHLSFIKTPCQSVHVARQMRWRALLNGCQTLLTSIQLTVNSAA